MGAIEHVRSADGTPIAYRTSGSGEPLVFVHGGATSGADWIPVARILRDRFTVVVMDRRGRGASGDGEAYAIEREAEDIAAVLDAAGGAAVVAHSYGAICALVAAGAGVPVRRLVLYEPPIGPPDRRLATVAAAVAADDVDTAVETFLLGVSVPAEQVAAIRRSPAWPILRDAGRVLPRELAELARWRLPPGPIEVPALLLTGADTDHPVYLQGFDDLRAAFPDHRAQTLPGQRHLGHVMAPEDFAQRVAEFCRSG